MAAKTREARRGGNKKTTNFVSAGRKTYLFLQQNNTKNLSVNQKQMTLSTM